MKLIYIFVSLSIYTGIYSKTLKSPKTNVTSPNRVSIKPFVVGDVYFMEIKYSRIEIFKKCGIYIIKNTINDRVYVGSSNNLYKRFNAHKNGLLNKKHDNPALTNFCRVYGIENLYIEIIEFCEENVLIERENFFIKFHNAYGKGFNCCPRAESPFKGIPISQKTRDRLSKSRKRYIKNNPDKNKTQLDNARLICIQMYKDGLLRSTNLGKKASVETRRRQSLAKKGKPSHLKESSWKAIRDAHKLKCSGEGSHYAKLTEANVLEIRRLLKENIMLKKDIAKIFNVSSPTMCDINYRRSWTHI